MWGGPARRRFGPGRGGGTRLPPVRDGAHHGLGFWLICRKMRVTYSERMPTPSRVTPEEKSTPTASDAQPGTSMLPANLERMTVRPAATDSLDSTTPPMDASRSGKVV